MSSAAPPGVPSGVLLLEAFYGGSHRQLMDLLASRLQASLVTMPAKKWHWRARTAALYLADNVPHSKEFKVLFTSSVLNLAELIALRPDLAGLKKIVYFHENQLVYPVRKQQDRDFQYGYNQVLSCLVADHIVFNSSYNKESFLTNISSFMKLIPDHRPKNLAERIRPKCRVLHFPILFPPRTAGCETDTGTSLDVAMSHNAEPSRNGVTSPDAMTVSDAQNSETRSFSSATNEQLESCKRLKLQEPQPQTNSDDMVPFSSTVETSSSVAQSNSKSKDKDSLLSFDTRSSDVTRDIERKPLHIVWPHRWEHDKDPDTFFKVLYSLQQQGVPFHLSVLGETYTDVPAIFAEAKDNLAEHIMNWGFQASKEAYYTILRDADVVVSTAKHEFFGVAMLEAVHLGCYPLCPNNLVYPEIFPKECLYNTENQLLKQLRQFAVRPMAVRKRSINVDTNKYSWNSLEPQFHDLLST